MKIHVNLLVSFGLLWGVTAVPPVASPATVQQWKQTAWWPLIPTKCRRLLPKVWDGTRKNPGAEIFCGCGALTQAYLDAGYENFLGYDLQQGRHMNFLTSLGLTLCFAFVLSVVENGFVWAGPQCSTWVWLSRGTAGRSNTNVDGDLSRKSVRLGNLTAKCLARVLRVAWIRKVLWAVEQPLSSIFWKSAAIAKLLLDCKAWRHFCWLGHWGHDITKPTVLYLTLPAQSKVKALLRSSKTKVDKMLKNKYSKKVAFANMAFDPWKFKIVFGSGFP